MEQLRDRSVWSLDDHYLVAEQECLLPHMPTPGKSVVLIFLKLYIYIYILRTSFMRKYCLAEFPNGYPLKLADQKHDFSKTSDMEDNLHILAFK